MNSTYEIKSVRNSTQNKLWVYRRWTHVAHSLPLPNVSCSLPSPLPLSLLSPPRCDLPTRFPNTVLLFLFMPFSMTSISPTSSQPTRREGDMTLSLRLEEIIQQPQDWANHRQCLCDFIRKKPMSCCGPTFLIISCLCLYILFSVSSADFSLLEHSQRAKNSFSRAQY